jgi:hypothetical protein
MKWSLIDALRQLHVANRRLAALEQAVVAMAPAFMSTVSDKPTI